MENLLRDAIWQFIGAILSLIAILISIFTYYKQKNRKSLVYKTLMDTEMLITNQIIRDKLQVLYDGVQVENLRLLVMRLINDGNIAIQPSDYKDNISFQFENNTKIISTKIIDVVPSNLVPEIVEKPPQVQIDPILLNSQDTFTIMFLLSQYNGKVEPMARIVGVSKIEEAKDNAGLFIIFLPPIIIALSIGIMLLLSMSKYPITPFYMVSMPIMLTSVVIALSVYSKEKKKKLAIYRKINFGQSTEA